MSHVSARCFRRRYQRQKSCCLTSSSYFKHYPPEYKSDYLNEAFATVLDDLILDTTPDYWIYGHHHRYIPEFKIGHTKLLTNQLGYVQHNEHQQYYTDRCIKI